MILSSPAPVAPHAPVVSLVPSLDPKASSTSKTSSFKNVFENLQQEGGSEQEGATLPKSLTKKEPHPDSGSGTEQTVVVQTPTQGSPKASLTLSTQPDVPESYKDSNAQGVNQEAPVAAPASSTGAQPYVLPLLSRAGVLNASSTALVRTATPTQTTVESIGSAPMEAGAPGLTPSSTGQPIDALRSITESLATGQVQANPTQGSGTSEPSIQQATIPKTLNLPLRESAPQVLSSASAIPEEQRLASLHPVGEPTPDQTRTTAQFSVKPAATSLTGLRFHMSALDAQPAADTSSQKAVPANAATKQSEVVEVAQVASTKALATPSKSSQPPCQARQLTPSSQPMLLADQIVPATPLPQPIASSMPPANVVPGNHGPAQSQDTAKSANSTVAPSMGPPSNALSAEEEPESTLAPVPRVGATSSQVAPAAGLEVDNRLPYVSTSPQHESLAVTVGSRTSLSTDTKNFAFAVNMLGPQASSRSASLTESKGIANTRETLAPTAAPKVPLTPPPTSSSRPPSQLAGETSSASAREEPSSATETEKPGNPTQKQFDLVQAPQAPVPTPRWSDATVLQTLEAGHIESPLETAETAVPNAPFAVQEAYLAAPEMPKGSASSEILLHLPGNDQSSAAIRIADRAGSVNVSVHASDPILRESLRSNLGELSAQLNTQGWKAEVLKSAAVAAHSESQQDSGGQGQRSSQQQQSSGGERQQQRDRRPSGGQWQREFDQQITGGDAHPGGNR